MSTAYYTATVKRAAGGGIDLDFYVRQAHQLRGETVGSGTRRLFRKLADRFGSSARAVGAISTAYAPPRA